MKILRIFISFFLVFCVVFALFFGKEKISEQKEYAFPIEYKGVLTLWQIDTFEGGSNSRKQFLMDVASSFEKQNKGVLISVETQNVLSAEENFNKGNYPDMISFGIGLNIENVSNLNINKNFIGGDLDGKSYAMPWCRGGYVLFCKNSNDFNKEIDNLIVSKGEYNNPLISLILSGITVKNYSVLESKTAYREFINSKCNYFLGTQRDVVRFNNLNLEYNVYPLNSFSDLYQYIAITSTKEQKRYYSERFIEFLLSNNSQEKLNKIDMFSEFIKVNNDLKLLNKMQNVDILHTFSAFTLREILEENYRFSVDVLIKDKEKINNIKNLLVLS